MKNEISRERPLTTQYEKRDISWSVRNVLSLYVGRPMLQRTMLSYAPKEQNMVFIIQ